MTENPPPLGRLRFKADEWAGNREDVLWSVSREVFTTCPLPKIC